MQFRILPPTDGVMFEDDDIAVRAFHGGARIFNTGGTLFFSVVSGRALVNGIPTRAGMYGCVPRVATFEGDDCRIMVVDAKRYPGIFSIGGPVEPVGRLRYINGCTDTGLIQPLKLGDPCLNALFFPAYTLQTRHHHPSHRVGAIYDGNGWCLTDQGPVSMHKGDIFLIPAQSLHWFKTEGSDMRIMVFHPDSEFGPTDEKHQMLEATVIANEPA